MYSPSIKKVDAGVISCSGPACAKTRPVRALYNPDGRHTHVGRFVRSAACAYKMISLYGSCCAGIHLWPAIACACRSLSRSPLSQSRSDARTRTSRYRTLFVWSVWWSWYLLAIARGGDDHEGVVFKDHLLICSRFSCSGLALKVAPSQVVTPLLRPWMQSLQSPEPCR